MMKRRGASNNNRPNSSSSLLPLTTTTPGNDRSSRSSKKRLRSSKTNNPTVARAVAFVCAVCMIAASLLVFLKRNAATRHITEPSFYTPNHNKDVAKESWPWEPEVIHIVKTRFMQEQASLTALGEARLALFKVFCLPTMRHQSTQHFLWIIKVDPDLDRLLLNQLIDEVYDMPNVYVVGSNVNFRVNEHFPGAWRDGAEGTDLTLSKIYTGNRTLLQHAMALQDVLPVLETRLDADDGLHYQFLETVQAEAAKTLWNSNNDNNNNAQWMYWCSRRHLEWHWVDDNSNKNKKLHFKESPGLGDMMQTYGAVQGIQHEKLCITPGITTGFAVGTREANVPVFAHDELVKKIKLGIEEKTNVTTTSKGCGLPDKSDCLQFVDAFVFEAIRSRSPTSHGMLRIASDPSELRSEWYVNYAFWNMLHESFGIERQQLRWMNAYLQAHLIDIARDNLLGQCTTGHSCKESARAELEQLIQSRRSNIDDDHDGVETNSTTGSN